MFLSDDQQLVIDLIQEDWYHYRIENIKRYIEEHKNISCSQQIIMFQNKEMTNNKSLLELYVEEGNLNSDTILLSLLVKPGETI